MKYNNLKQIDNKTILDFLSSTEWNFLKLKTIIKNNNKCNYCKGNYRLNIKHIKSLSFNWHLRLNPNNIEIICDKCKLDRLVKFNNDLKNKSRTNLSVRYGEKATLVPTLNQSFNTKQIHINYINSNRWQRFKAAFLKRYPQRCVCCSSTSRLHLHHKTYENFGKEKFEDMCLVCKSCHDEIHTLHNSLKNTVNAISLKEATDRIIESYVKSKEKLLMLYKRNKTKKKKKAVLRCQMF